MSLLLVVDPDDPTPPYEQVRRQITDLIETGRLRSGDRMPPLRQLAGDLGLAVGTVARAYRELEAGGLLRSRRGAGTRVAARPDLERPDERLRELAAAYVVRTRALGCADRDIESAVRRALGSGDVGR